LLSAGWIPMVGSGQVGRTVVVRRFSSGDRVRTVLLWRTQSDEPVAMDSVCPHKPISMVGARLVGDALECPVHRRLFGPNGSCLNRPDGKPARTVEVREAGGYLWVAR
jgi:vanillate O-demethylase monooxygenase subunit